MPPCVLGYLDPEHLRRRPPQAAARAQPRGDRARWSRGRWASRSSRPRSASTASSTPRWPKASASCRSARATTRAGSRCCRWAAAAPLHACALAEELGLGRILVPRLPGVLSAAGLLAAPVEHEVSAALPRRARRGSICAEVRDTLDQLDERCRALMAQENVGDADVARRYFADVCYIGQGYHLEVPFDCARRGPVRRADAPHFYAAHDRIYGYAPKAPIRLVNLRTVHSVAGATDSCRTSGRRPAGRRSCAGAHPAARAAGRCRGHGLRPRRAEGGRRLRRPRHHRAGRHHHAASRPAGIAGSTPLGNLMLERHGN